MKSAVIPIWLGLLALCLPLAAGAVTTPGSDVLATVNSADVYLDRHILHVVLTGKLRSNGATAAIYLRSDDGGAHWRSSRRIDRDGEPAMETRAGNEAQIAARGRHVLAAWQQRGAMPGVGPMRVAYSDDGGMHWRQGDNPASGDAMHNQSHLDAAVDDAGHFHLVWLDDREENGNTQGLRHAYSADGGRRWPGETTIDGQVCTCCWNRLIALPGQALAVLYRNDDPHDMALARRDAGGWRQLGPVGAFHWQFHGCPHCGGGLAASGRTLHSVVWTGAEGQAGLHYLRSADGGARWSEPRRLGDVQARAADIAAWSSARLAVAYTEAGERGTRLALIHSGDAGATWSAPETLAPAEAQAGTPRLFATPFGLRAFWIESDGAGGKRWRMAFITQFNATPWQTRWKK